MTKHKRRIKLVDPKLQIQLTLIFVSLSALGLLIQFILFQSTLSRLASELPHDGARVMDAVNGSLPGVLGITLIAIMPLVYAVGVLTTFRIAGPVYRMKQYLRQVAEEGYKEPVRLRKGDKLVDLAEQLSATLQKLSEHEPTRTSGTDAPDAEAA